MKTVGGQQDGTYKTKRDCKGESGVTGLGWGGSVPGASFIGKWDIYCNSVAVTSPGVTRAT